MQRDPEPLPSVPIGDLSRRPREVLDRVAAGERLIVSRHGRPVATLQPLDGYVFQPFEGTAHDVFGWPIGGIEDEIAKLNPAQQALLGGCYKDWRLRPVRLPEDLQTQGFRSLGDLEVRGLARKTSRGWELTGRGLALHEALRGRYGQDHTLPGMRVKPKEV
jgi:prevent-host-death family protein